MNCTYKEIPKEISQIIYGDTEAPQTMLCVGECSLFDVIGKIIYETAEHSKCEEDILYHFKDSVKKIYDYMQAWQKHWKKEFNLKFVDEYKTIKNILLGESVKISTLFIRYAASYYDGVYENININPTFLIKLIEQLKKENEYEEDIKNQSEEIFSIIKHMSYTIHGLNTVHLLTERLRLEGKESEFYLRNALYYYGYVEGKRAERAKKKKIKYNIAC